MNMYEIDSLSFTRVLLGQALSEVGSFMLWAGAVIIIRMLVNKLSVPVRAGIGLLLFLIQMFILHHGNILSEIYVSVMLALLMSISLYIMKIMKISLSDIPYFAACMLFSRRLFNSSFSLFGYGIEYLMLLYVLILYMLLISRNPRRNLIRSYISFLMISLELFIFDITSDICFTFFRENGSHSFILISLITLICVIILVLSFTASNYLEKLADSMSRLSIRQKQLNHWITVFMMIDIVIFLFFDFPFVLMNSYTNLQIYFLAVFYLILLAFQLMFLVLLFKLTDYRTQYEYFNRMKDIESDYEKSYMANTQAVAGIRHDIKNIFLTMNDFIERSSDQEMKDFYREKIYSYAAGEIEKSNLYSKLYELPSQNLRAFLYLKLTEAQNQGIPVRLHISIVSDASFQPAIVFIDLTRILGIFLDNAFEEERGYDDGFVQIDIASGNNEISFSIKNALNPSHNNIKPEENSHGLSSKADHSGIGLSTVQMILTDYPDIIHNAYQKDGIYLQSLIIR